VKVSQILRKLIKFPKCLLIILLMRCEETGEGFLDFQFSFSYPQFNYYVPAGIRKDHLSTLHDLKWTVRMKRIIE